jgi:hypothetical protein
MANGGRPVIYTEEKIEEIKKEMDEYIETCKGVPSIAEFALDYGYRRATLYEHEGLSYNVEKILLKREVTLEKLGLSRKSNPSMVIFSLKQLGWSDKKEINLNGSMKHDYQNKTDEELDAELAALEQDEEN